MNGSRTKQFYGGALIALALALPAVSQAQATNYAFVDIGVLKTGGSSVGYSINASGQVTGYSDYTTGGSAFLYLNNALTSLNQLVTGSSCTGRGINDIGQVAGQTAMPGSSNLHAVVWTGTTPTDLGTLGGAVSVACGINNSGQTVGYSDTASGLRHAFRYSNGVMTDLGAFGGGTSYGYGINASGQVVGYSITSNSVYHAFLYTNGVMNDINPKNSAGSNAYAINNSGQVAGAYQVPGSPSLTHAYRYSNAVVTDLGTLSGGNNSQAKAINSAGLVVGNSTGHAFLYAAAMLDLNNFAPSGWVLTDATGINDNGWITGTGTVGGKQHAYLLMPTTGGIAGQIALEGIDDLSTVSPLAPLGTLHVSFRTPGTLTEVYHRDISLNTTTGGTFVPYTLPGAPAGIYDVWIKGTKTLAVLSPSVSFDPTASGMPMPDVMLPAGDANNDNSVDQFDFTILAAAFGHAYDPRVDFNFDGKVDTADFDLLVGEYGNTGDM